MSHDGPDMHGWDATEAGNKLIESLTKVADKPENLAELQATQAGARTELAAAGEKYSPTQQRPSVDMPHTDIHEPNASIGPSIAAKPVETANVPAFKPTHKPTAPHHEASHTPQPHMGPKPAHKPVETAHATAPIMPGHKPKPPVEVANTPQFTTAEAAIKPDERKMLEARGIKITGNQLVIEEDKLVTLNGKPDSVRAHTFDENTIGVAVDTSSKWMDGEVSITVSNKNGTTDTLVIRTDITQIAQNIPMPAETGSADNGSGNAQNAPPTKFDSAAWEKAFTDMQNA